MKTLQKKLISLFLRHPEYFIRSISSGYPFTNEQLRKYSDKLLWGRNHKPLSSGGLSINDSLPWSKELVNEHIEKWSWSALSIQMIGAKFWYNGLLDDYYEWINWNGLSYNMELPWTDAIIEKYKDKLNWEFFSSNEEVVWTPQRIKKFENYIDFEGLSNSLNTPWGRPSKLRNPLRFSNKTSPLLSLTLLEKYEERLDWDHLVFQWGKGLNKKETDEVIDGFMNLAF